MTTAHVDVIERSVEKTHVWLKDLARELRHEDQQQAYRVLRAFLHAVRDRLAVEEAAQLGAQLPTFIRGVYYEGWRPGAKAERYRDVDSFLAHIAREANLAGGTEASFAASAAATVLRRHVSTGETDSVLHAMPARVRAVLGGEQ
jgi:uncharacterized protein (DUF2267 family)